MAFIQLKNYTQLTIQNNTTNNYISLARQKLMTVILKQLISQWGMIDDNKYSLLTWTENVKMEKKLYSKE